MTAAQRWTLTVVCVSTAVLLINVAAPNVALEAIADDLGASFTDLQWVLSGYSLVLAVFQLTAGSLADLLGAVLQSTIAGRVEERTDGLGAARGAVTDRIADGDVASATQLAPAAARDSLRTTYEAAFASALNELLLISVVLALVGLTAALVLVRTRDLWRPQEA